MPHLGLAGAGVGTVVGILVSVGACVRKLIGLLLWVYLVNQTSILCCVALTGIGWFQE